MNTNEFITVSDFKLNYWAEKSPNKIAVSDTLQSLTYRELNEKSYSLANFLFNKGLHTNATVMLFMHNCIEIPIVLYASIYAGFNIVPANPLFKTNELEQLLNEIRPDIIFVYDGDEKEAIHKLIQDIPVITANLANKDFSQALNSQARFPLQAPDMQTCIMAVSSSGSTGKLKFIARTFENQIIPATYISKHLGANEKDVFYIPLPLAQQFGLITMIACIIAGGTIIITSRFQPEKALELIEKYKVTIQFGVPTMYGREITAYEAMEHKPNISSLRTGMISGSSGSVKYFKWFEDHADCKLLNAYGTTEIASVTMLDLNDPEDARYHSCGKVFDNAEISIIDEKGNSLPNGQIGQIVCKTPCIMEEYIGAPEQTFNSFDELERFLTGDIGYFDSDNYLHICGRKNSMIIRGGYNVFPAEVESVLLHYPDIAEACVLGYQDGDLGERIAAFVKMKPAFSETEASLRERMKNSIAKYKVPDRIIFLNRIPKLSNGKNDYQALSSILKNQKNID